MKVCEIEKIEIAENVMPHALVNRILQQEKLAMVAMGSLACVRILWFRACRSGRLERFFGCTVSDWEYGMGKQGEKLRQTVRKALKCKGVRGIVIYASCMEYLTMWDWEAELRELDIPEGISIYILYRGPLAKRSMDPSGQLSGILQSLDLSEEGAERDHNIDSGKGFLPSLPPVAPDFEGIMAALGEMDCDILLLSPGGCKSCIERLGGCAGCYGSRMQDISVCNGCEKELAQVICEQFACARPLVLLGSAIFYAVGCDMEKLAEQLQERGKQAVYLESNGFEECPEAVDRAMLKLGKLWYREHADYRKDCGIVWITGYSEMTVGEKRELYPVISHLEKRGYEARFWGEALKNGSGPLFPEVVWLVSSEGLSLAQWMDKEFDIPFVIGRPYDETAAERMAESLICAARGEPALCCTRQSCKFSFPDNQISGIGQKGRLPGSRAFEENVWIIGEPVWAAGVYEFYTRKMSSGKIKTAVYAPAPETKQHYEKLSDDWIYFSSPGELTACITCGTVIADPLIIRALQEVHPEINGIGVAFPEISGSLF